MKNKRNYQAGESVMSYRPELPEVPERMHSLPIRRGYPVPWFVALVDGDYHFPTADGRKFRDAIDKHLCWVCGKPLGAFKSFVIGPMCAVNRTTSEPPCHHECAVFSAKACPFLARPHMKRQKEKPDDAQSPAGMFIERNPGVSLVWTARSFSVISAPRSDGRQGILFRVGPATGALWFAEGRAATREEVMASITSGMPILAKIAKEDGPEALKQLDRQYAEALRLLPA